MQLPMLRARPPDRAVIHTRCRDGRRYCTGGSGGGSGSGGNSGGGGGNPGGSDEGPWRGLAWPFMLIAAYAAASEGYSCWQYRGMAARDARRRAELFPCDASPSQQIVGSSGSSSGCPGVGASRNRQQQQQQTHPQQGELPSVSVIVPALNEAAGLEATLRFLQHRLQPAASEIIVVDGGSSDATVAIARRCGARVVQAGRGRARQMNAGAAVATGAAPALHAARSMRA